MDVRYHIDNFIANSYDIVTFSYPLKNIVEDNERLAILLNQDGVRFIYVDERIPSVNDCTYHYIEDDPNEDLYQIFNVVSKPGPAVEKVEVEFKNPKIQLNVPFMFMGYHAVIPTYLHSVFGNQSNNDQFIKTLNREKEHFIKAVEHRKQFNDIYINSKKLWSESQFI